MVKAIAKSIIIAGCMFFGGILIANMFLMIARTNIACFSGLSLGAVLGLIIGYVIIVCNE